MLLCFALLIFRWPPFAFPLLCFTLLCCALLCFTSLHSAFLCIAVLCFALLCLAFVVGVCEGGGALGYCMIFATTATFLQQLWPSIWLLSYWCSYCCIFHKCVGSNLHAIRFCATFATTATFLKPLQTSIWIRIGFELDSNWIQIRFQLDSSWFYTLCATTVTFLLQLWPSIGILCNLCIFCNNCNLSEAIRKDSLTPNDDDPHSPYLHGMVSQDAAELPIGLPELLAFWIGDDMGAWIFFRGMWGWGIANFKIMFS